MLRNKNKKINLNKPMKRFYSKSMRTLVIAAIMLASAASLWAQGDFTDPTAIPLSDVAVTTPRDGFISTPALPSPTDDFSSMDSQPSFVSSSLTIQAVPEPSTFALGILAFGLVTLARISRKTA
jgi:hypothetical protein